MEVVRYTTEIQPAVKWGFGSVGTVGRDAESGKCLQIVGFKRKAHHRSGIEKLTFTLKEVTVELLDRNHAVHNFDFPGTAEPPVPIEDTDPEDIASVRRMAYHESGHAVVWVIRNCKLALIVIAADAAHVDPEPHCTSSAMVRAEVAIAGGIAQRLHTGFEPMGHEVEMDLQALGMWIEDGSHTQLSAEVEHMLKLNWDAVDALANALINLKRYGGTREMPGDMAEEIIHKHLVRKESANHEG